MSSLTITVEVLRTALSGLGLQDQISATTLYNALEAQIIAERNGSGPEGQGGGPSFLTSPNFVH
jgi:hypothetical protein